MSGSRDSAVHRSSCGSSASRGVDRDARRTAPSRIAPATVRELHDTLKAGGITGSGCVDGGERRAISPAEWHDYRLRLEHMRSSRVSSGVPVITVLSIRSFPAGSLKHHGYRSGVRIPSAQSSGGEPGYHRVIDDVRCNAKRSCSIGLHLVVRHRPLLHRRGADPNFKAHSAQSLRSIPMACQTKRQNRILSCADVLARSLRPLACPRFRMTPF